MCQTRETTTVDLTSIFIWCAQTCVSVDISWLVLVIVVDVSWDPLSSITILLDGNCWNKHITYIKMDFLSGYSARTSARDKSPVMNRNTKETSFTTTHLRRPGIDQFWRHLWRHWKHVREFWPVQCVERLRNRIDLDETCESVHWTLDRLASYAWNLEHARLDIWKQGKRRAVTGDNARKHVFEPFGLLLAPREKKFLDIRLLRGGCSWFHYIFSLPILNDRPDQRER